MPEIPEEYMRKARAWKTLVPGPRKAGEPWTITLKTKYDEARATAPTWAEARDAAVVALAETIYEAEHKDHGVEILPPPAVD